MERNRVKEENSHEEMYFEMDFTPSDEINSEDELDDSSSLSDTQDDISISQDLRLTTIQAQILCSSSSSIAIRSSTLASTPTSGQNTPSTFRSPSNKSQPRTISPSCLISRSSAGTPLSSVSPSSSFIPRIFRESFSKLIKRTSNSRAKSPEKEQACSDSECYNCERRSSECSIVSPATEEVVKESLRKGLPIIPFAYPTFFTAGRNQEDVKRRIRKNSIRSLKRSFSEGRCLDYSEAIEEEETLKKFTSEDKSLDSIVKIAKQEIKMNKQDIANHPASRKQSQSSYVEMNPEEMFEREDDPYMRMENFTENDYLHMERKKTSEEPLFDMENHPRNPANDLSMTSCDLLEKKLPKRKNNLFQIGKGKSDLQIQDSIGRQLKKGNKHKDDYVFFDFEKKKDYVDMGKAKTKKWQFLDFKNDK